jgi:plastocyanin
MLKGMRFAVAGILALVGLFAAGCGSGYGGANSTAPTGTAATGGGKSISITAADFSLDPSKIQIDQPGTYTIQLTNNGKTGHALEVEGQGIEDKTDTINPGDMTQLTVEITKPGTYEFYCPVDGHRGLGMEGTLTLGSGGGSGGTGTDTGGSSTGKDGGYGYG